MERRRPLEKGGYFMKDGYSIPSQSLPARLIDDHEVHIGHKPDNE